jgi:mono/diheme cytochrome c family protein
MNFRSLILVAFLSFALAACNFSLAEDITPPPGYLSPTPPPTVGPLYPSAAPSPRRGALLYAQECQPCHGDRGLGNGELAAQMPVAVPAIGLREVAGQFSPADWYSVVSIGNLSQGMPPFTSLSAGQRWDVLSYVYTLGTTPDQLGQAAALYAAKCAACHGPGGRGDGSQATGLNPAPKDFTDQQIMSLITGSGLYRAIADGVPPAMAAFGGQLSQDDTWGLVAYLRTLAFDTTAPTSTPLPSATPLPPTEIASPTGTEPAQTGPTASPPVTSASGTPAPATAPGVSTGSVTGKVLSGTGSALPSDLTVTLHGFDADPAGGSPQEVLSLSQPVPADGAFRFENVAMPAGRSFVALVEYDGVPYESASSTAGQNAAALELAAVTLYPTTQDLNALKVQQVHIILDFSTAGTVQAVELYIMTNPGQKTVLVTSDGSSIPFVKLPDQAGNVSFQIANGSAAFMATATGFALPPTSADQKYGLVVLFDLPYPNKLAVSLPFVLATDALTILTPEGVKVEGVQVSDGGTQDVQGTTYHVYNGQPLIADASLAITISGTPSTAAATTTANSTRTGLMIGAGGLGLILIAIGVFLFLRDRARGNEDEEAGTDAEADSLGNDPDDITDAIIALDEKFKAGGLSKEAYAVRRAELKERLKRALE